MLTLLRGVKRCENGVEDVIQILAKILGKEAWNEIAVLLEQGVFASIATIGIGIGEVSLAIEFDDEPGLGVEEIDFHHPAAVEWDR